LLCYKIDTRLARIVPPRGTGWEPDPAATGSELNNPNPNKLFRITDDSHAFRVEFARAERCFVGAKFFLPQAPGAVFLPQGHTTTLRGQHELRIEDQNV
jgi:hypothetical protein